MSKIIDDYLHARNISQALSECINNDMNYFAILLARSYALFAPSEITLTNVENSDNIIVNASAIQNKFINVMLHCNWDTSEELCKLWNKMSKGNFIWNNIRIVSEEPADYHVVINSPISPTIEFSPEQKKKTIVFRMEPNMELNDEWRFWKAPVEEEFKFVGYHDKHYNNNEWHLSKTYNELMSEQIIKTEDVLSSVLSEKYFDPGHVKRIDFVKFLETKGLRVDVYGSNKFDWVNYKGELPSHQKDNAVFPYKYTFNVENHSLRGYYTEKLIDGILGECLVFYHGCPNIRDYFDERAIVWLDLSNFERDYEIVKRAIEEDWWSQRIGFIREAKQKILNELQFFPRLEKIIGQI
jgi:hypothetical protein